MVRETLLLGTIGTALGTLASLAANRYIAGQLFGVTPRDPVAIVVALSVLGIVTMVAGCVPATALRPCLSARPRTGAPVKPATGIPRSAFRVRGTAARLLQECEPNDAVEDHMKDEPHMQRGQGLTGREKRPTPLTAKQARFVEEYLIDMNGAAAARRAGYSKKASAEAGYQLLTNTHVQAAIAAGRAKLSEACNIQALDIVKEVARGASGTWPTTQRDE